MNQYNEISTLQYMGSKTRIISHICEPIIKNKSIKTVVDLFAGTGSVGYALKAHKNIISNDLEYYAYIINHAILADDTLLVKYKETVFYIFVLADVVPRVDDDLVLVVIAVLMGGEQEWSQLVLPFTGIALACSGDDVNIKRIFHRRIRNVKISALLKIVIGESSSGFTGTDPAA